MKRSVRSQATTPPGPNATGETTSLHESHTQVFLPVQKPTRLDLLDRRDHASADVTFITGPVAGIEHMKCSGFIQTENVMAGSLDRIGDPDKFAVEGAHDLDVHAGGLVLPRVQSRLAGP